jgi:predicted nucleic acid-binding protein
MTNKKWVLNASPTILLAKISLIGLVADLCSEAIIPSGVAQEIMAGRLMTSRLKSGWCKKEI